MAGYHPKHCDGRTQHADRMSSDQTSGANIAMSPTLLAKAAGMLTAGLRASNLGASAAFILFCHTSLTSAPAIVAEAAPVVAHEATTDRHPSAAPRRGMLSARRLGIFTAAVVGAVPGATALAAKFNGVRLSPAAASVAAESDVHVSASAQSLQKAPPALRPAPGCKPLTTQQLRARRKLRAHLVVARSEHGLDASEANEDGEVTSSLLVTGLNAPRGRTNSVTVSMIVAGQEDTPHAIVMKARSCDGISITEGRFKLTSVRGNSSEPAERVDNAAAFVATMINPATHKRVVVATLGNQPGVFVRRAGA
jgi:hypothetical protein